MLNRIRTQIAICLWKNHFASSLQFLERLEDSTSKYGPFSANLAYTSTISQITSWSTFSANQANNAWESIVNCKTEPNKTFNACLNEHATDNMKHAFDLAGVYHKFIIERHFRRNPLVISKIFMQLMKQLWDSFIPAATLGAVSSLCW